MGLRGLELYLYVIRQIELVDKTEFCKEMKNNILKIEGQISFASDLFLILLLTA